MRIETSADFIVEGGSRSDELLGRLTLVPTKTWNAGDRRRMGARAVHTRAGWSLRSPLPKTATVAEHLRALLVALRPHRRALKIVVDQFEGGFSVGVITHGAKGPDLYFDQTLLRDIVDLGADLDIDLYSLPDTHAGEGHVDRAVL